jgi:hypothetical protein
MMQMLKKIILIFKLPTSKRCTTLLRNIDLNQDGGILELLLEFVLLMIHSLMLGDHDLFFTDILHFQKEKTH